MRLSRKSSRTYVVALVVCACLAAGCETLQVPRIDPTGQRIFAAGPLSTPGQYGPPFAPATVPGPPPPSMSVNVAPCRLVTPVGREVVLLAGVCDRGQPSPKRRLEWSIAPGGVGHFVAVGRNTLIDRLVGDFNKTQKVDNTFAIGSTSRKSFTLDRGTPTPCDDVGVQRGQGWVSITSPVEGTSRVTVYAPEVPAWEARTATAEIHWIDAAWQSPPPAINPAGSSHVLTTTVTRQSDGSPCTGWLVRYQIVDGPAAGFLPDLAQAVEVPADVSGRAGVEITQLQPVRGTNRVAVEILHPSGTGGQRAVVGREVVLVTWTAADLAVSKLAPAGAGIGAPFAYRIEVSNPGDLPADNVTVTDALPEGLSYLESTPPAVATGNTLVWSLGQLAPAASQSIELRCRAERIGEVVNRVDVAADGGLAASHSATTTVAAPEVGIRIDGPAQVAVGGQAKFVVLITNRGQVPTGDLTIKDRLGPGLDHPVAIRGAIERDLGSLQPGETHQIDVTFTTTQAGRLCHTVEVVGPEGVRARAEGCVTAVAAAPGAEPTPPPSLPPEGPAKSSPGGEAAPFEPRPWPPGTDVRPSEPSGEAAQPPEQPAAPAEVSVRVTGPKEVTEGELARFFIDVTNTGQRTLSDLEIVNDFDPELSPKAATDEYRHVGTRLSWTLGRLPVGRTYPFELHFDCLRAAQAACNRVTVTSAEGAEARGEACTRIRSAQGDLAITVADLRDPVAVTKELTYEIRVTNHAETTAREIRLVATVPPGMVPNPIGTSGPPGVEYFIEGQSVQFKPIAEIPTGPPVTYRVRVRTVRAGRQTFRVELSGPGLPQAVTAEEVTEVFE